MGQGKGGKQLPCQGSPLPAIRGHLRGANTELVLEQVVPREQSRGSVDQAAGDRAGWGQEGRGGAGPQALRGPRPGALRVEQASLSPLGLGRQDRGRAGCDRGQGSQ